MKTLVIYYSISCGNTKKIAEQIAAKLGADIARIETVVPYSGSYDDIVEQGQKEVESGYMPEIKPLGANIADYDRLIIGTPTWWYTMAPAVLTFLKNNDFTGKTVVPFQTHGGWKGHALADMGKVCKGAKIENGKDIRFDSTGGDKQITPVANVQKWIDSL
jgi:flavodoxin